MPTGLIGKKKNALGENGERFLMEYESGWVQDGVRMH